ncbi:hypothetical protein D3C81_2260310 [compost metagenome]
MIGVRVGRRVESQHMPFSLLPVHDPAPDVAVAGPWRAGLHEEHRFDPRLHRVLREAVEHRHARVPET